jgi:hypothetical protein
MPPWKLSKMPLIPNAKHSWKFGSNIMFLLIAILSGVESRWEGVFSQVMPQEWYAPIVAILAVLGIVVRHIDQGLEE